MNATEKTLQTRTSLRRYADRPISEEERLSILSAAMAAPTAGNMMLYSIIEITDQALKESLVETCDGQSFIAKAPLVLLFLADQQRWHDFFVHGGVPKMCDEHGLNWREPEESDLMLGCCDALIAAQNSVIAAESLGIGSCYIGDIMENYERHRDIFELPRWTFPIALVCYGHYPDGERPARRGRLPMEIVVHRNVYRKADEKVFDIMEGHRQLWSITKIGAPAENGAQKMYLRKNGAPFSFEMSRSVKAAISRWLGEEPKGHD